MSISSILARFLTVIRQNGGDASAQLPSVFGPAMIREEDKSRNQETLSASATDWVVSVQTPNGRDAGE